MRQPFAEFVRNELGNAFVLIACGLPATWKTETTEEISKMKNVPMLRTDIIRLEVLKNEDVFDNKVASDMKKRNAVYEETFSRADHMLGKGHGVILDATFVTQELRRYAADLADRHNMTFVILQTSCPQEISLRRISQRTRENYESNAITEEAYFNNKKKFEPVDLNDLKNLYPNLKIIHATVDTSYNEPEGWYIIDIRKR